MQNLLVEREESVAAFKDSLKNFCGDLQEIRIASDHASDTDSEDDNERQHFIVDDDSE